MKPFDAKDTKSRAKGNLSLNILDLGDKISLKRLLLIVFDSVLGIPKYLSH